MNLRIALLKGITLVGLLCVLATEVLSAFQWLGFKGVAAFWFATGLAWLLFLSKGKYFSKPIFFPKNDFQKSEVFLLLCIGLIVMSTGLIALAAPPNNFDSMTYHMARVPHWIQNRSVNFYATNNLRQLWPGPLAEYGILHLQLLSGSDRYANMVQWGAMAGCLLAASVMTGLLGGNRRQQLLSALLVAVLPMGILQATSTQNDYMVALWLSLMGVFVISYCRTDMVSFVFYSGLCLGLGMLTKGTMYIYGGTLAAVFLAVLLNIKGKKAARATAVIFVVAFLINTPHYLRNYDLGGHILTPDQHSRELVNETHLPKALFSLVIRNIGVHLDSPLSSLNALLNKAVYGVHAALNIDTNSPATTLGQAFKIERGIDEDSSGNFFHLILFCAALGLFLARKETRKNKLLRIFAVYIFLSFLGFSFYLKWQPWASRLHLPLFVTGLPFVGYVLGGSKRRGLIVFLMIVLCGISVEYIVKNPKKRLVSKKKATLFNTSRERLYFITEGSLYPAYRDIVDIISTSGCRDIGLKLGRDSWEYPWWVMLEVRTQSFRIEHVGVDNQSKKYEDPFFRPCALVKRGKGKDILTLKGSVYNKVYNHGDLVLYFDRVK